MYVNKEEVQKCLDDVSNENLIGNDNDTFISLAEAHDRIEELPTADAVEVVRCRFCMFAEEYQGQYICNNTMAPWFNDDMNVYMKPHDFCSYGAREQQQDVVMQEGDAQNCKCD